MYSKYTADQKRAIVDIIDRESLNASVAADRYHVCYMSIKNWVKRFGSDKLKERMLSRKRLGGRRLNVDSLELGRKLYKENKLSLEMAAREAKLSDTSLLSYIREVEPEIIRKCIRTSPTFREQSKPVVPTPVIPKVHSASVLGESSIRALTPKELMCGKAGGYGAKVLS